MKPASKPITAAANAHLIEQHTITAIQQALDESTVSTSKKDTKRRTIDTKQFLMKAVSYLTRKEHAIYEAGYARGLAAGKEGKG
jgi:hypothetical protein